MAATVSLRLLNNASTLEVAMGTTLMEVVQTIELDTPYPILAARVNNRYKELGYRIYKPVEVEFFDMRHRPRSLSHKNRHISKNPNRGTDLRSIAISLRRETDHLNMATGRREDRE